MERDFKYLVDKYTESGAREMFERICTEIINSRFDETYPVKTSHGDGGLDIFVGDLHSPIDVYQCKFFINGIDNSQHGQINASFKTAIESSEYTMKSWWLCVPCVLTLQEHMWWSDWKYAREAELTVEIHLLDGNMLLTDFKTLPGYNSIFDEDIRASLEEIKDSLKSRNSKIYNELIADLSDEESKKYDELIFVKKLLSTNIIETDEYKKDFFNAEISQKSIYSKGNHSDILVFEHLKKKIYSIWNTQYLKCNERENGAPLLGETYERIEDLDTSTLASIDDINMLAKKGMLHQYADDCSIGWVKDYKIKLAKYLLKDVDDHENQ